MTDIVVGVGGHARSGKTSIAELVASTMGWQLVRFSSEVERVARERHMPLDPPEIRRQTLMSVGEDLVTTQPVEFTRRVLAQANWAPGMPLVVEGVRHVSIAEHLTRLVAPAAFRLILVSTSAEVRERRLAAEGNTGAEARRRLDAHSTEREVSLQLADLAALTVDGSGHVEIAAGTIVNAIRRWQNSEPGSTGVDSRP